MRTKPIALLGLALAGALGLLAGSQTWVTFTFAGAADAERASGHAANAALSPISIALLAGALALTIAGRVFRRVLGALVVLLGGGLVALTITVLRDPLGAVASKVTELTGLSGSGSMAGIASHTTTWWCYLSLCAGALAVLIGLLVLFASGGWGASGRRFEAAGGPATATTAEQAGAAERRVQQAPDRISDWDALTHGDDPTESD